MPLRTFSIQTLGCRVNHYESEQMASLLRHRWGLAEVGLRDHADLRIVHTCSVTTEAANKSRQSVRRATRLPVLQTTRPDLSSVLDLNKNGNFPATAGTDRRPRVVVTGCWATSDLSAASAIPGVDAVLGHDSNLAQELDRLLADWTGSTPQGPAEPSSADADQKRHASSGDNGWNDVLSASPDGANATSNNQPLVPLSVKKKNANIFPHPSPPPVGWAPPTSSSLPPSPGTPGEGRGEGSAPRPPKFPSASPSPRAAAVPPASSSPSSIPHPPSSPPPLPPGTTSLPLLSTRQSHHQRAFLKIQDGCDAHCTYCIIPQLRPRLWSKPLDETIREAQQLVAAGHAELVLTGIFIGAYGQPTALRRRQPHPTAKPLAELLTSLCHNVPGLKRLRVSSMEPGDLTDDLIDTMRALPQIVPHFHLPLQSGSDTMLRRMNRQYTRSDFLHMVDRVNASFDRPALTTDIIVGFPGETPADFDQTLDVARRANFIHIHAFPYSPRPNTAAARWTKGFIPPTTASSRIQALNDLAAEQSYHYRLQFLHQPAEILIEHPTPPTTGTTPPVGWAPPTSSLVSPSPASPGDRRGEGLPPSSTLHPPSSPPPLPRHGRCERYFPITLTDPTHPVTTGQSLRVRITQVTPHQTLGTPLP